MKGKKFYITLIGLIIIGIGSVFIYRQQQEARFLEFEGYEISDIEKQVAGLYNEDKTDLADGISKEELEELEVTLSDLQEKDLGRQNKNRIELMQEELTTAEGMLTLEDDIDEIFIEDTIVDKDISVSEVEDFEEEIATYEDKTIYHERNMSSLSDAKQQLEAMTNARDFVENLFTDEDVVREDVTREEEEEALELIDQVQNEEVKEELTAQIEMVTLALNEREELEALEEELVEEDEADEEDSETEEDVEEEFEETEEVEEAEEIVEEPEYTAPIDTEEGASSNSNWNNSGNSSSSSESNDGTNHTPPNNTEEPTNPENTNPVVETYEETESEVIPYETIYIDDNTILEGNKYPVNQNYENGSRTVTYQVTVYQDGTTERQIISENTEPSVNQEIIRGTREPQSEE